MNRRGFIGALLAPLVTVPEPEPKHFKLTWEMLEVLHKPTQMGRGWIRLEDFAEKPPVRIGSDFTDAKVRLTEHWRGNNCTRTVAGTVIDSVDYERRPFVLFESLLHEELGVVG